MTAKRRKKTPKIVTKRPAVEMAAPYTVRICRAVEIQSKEHTEGKRKQRKKRDLLLVAISLATSGGATKKVKTSNTPTARKAPMAVKEVSVISR